MSGASQPSLPERARMSGCIWLRHGALAQSSTGHSDAAPENYALNEGPSPNGSAFIESEVDRTVAVPADFAGHAGDAGLHNYLSSMSHPSASDDQKMPWKRLRRFTALLSFP